MLAGQCFPHCHPNLVLSLIPRAGLCPTTFTPSSADTRAVCKLSHQPIPTVPIRQGTQKLQVALAALQARLKACEQSQRDSSGGAMASCKDSPPMAQAKTGHGQRPRVHGPSTKRQVYITSIEVWAVAWVSVDGLRGLPLYVP